METLASKTMLKMDLVKNSIKSVRILGIWEDQSFPDGRLTEETKPGPGTVPQSPVARIKSLKSTYSAMLISGDLNSNSGALNSGVLNSGALNSFGIFYIFDLIIF